jgi:hypothetical protein
VKIWNSDELAVSSRINYAKIYTIEHNLKVCFIGTIHADSRAVFFTDFKRVFEDDEEEKEELERRT